jgi:hypothetical protein
VPTSLIHGLCPSIRWLRIERIEGSRLEAVRIFGRTDFRPTSPVEDPTSLLMLRCAPGPQLLVHSDQIRQRAGLHLVHNLTPLNFNGDLAGT